MGREQADSNILLGKMSTLTIDFAKSNDYVLQSSFSQEHNHDLLDCCGTLIHSDSCN